MVQLDVPYREKDDAKALGARWNYQDKHWYCEEDQLEKFARWYHGELLTDMYRRVDADTTMTEDGTFRSKIKADDSISRTYGQSTEKNDKSSGSISVSDNFETVTAVTDMIATYFLNNSMFQVVRVKGEVSNYSLWNGHHFFTIKDQTSVLKCILWKSTAELLPEFKLEDGKQVGLLGSLRFNTKRSEGELIVARVFDLGEGDVNLELELLKQKLQAEGLFDIEKKKEIPKYPARIGIVTSKGGDAIKDICRVAHDRNPYVQLFLYSVTVQGTSAAASIIKGIRRMDLMGYDLIIVSRGGGSREDLSPFDDEGVVRAVFAAKTPIVTGVGHERDWTLIDLAADKRFSTPTYAAQGVIPDVMSDIRRIEQLRASIRSGISQVIRKKYLILEIKRERLGRYDPRVVLQKKTDRLDRLRDGIRTNMGELLHRRKHRLDVQIATLHGNSPTAKLVKGFGYISKDGEPVMSVETVEKDDELMLNIHDGQIRTRVVDVIKQGKDQ